MRVTHVVMLLTCFSDCPVLIFQNCSMYSFDLLAEIWGGAL